MENRFQDLQVTCKSIEEQGNQTVAVLEPTQQYKSDWGQDSEIRISLSNPEAVQAFQQGMQFRLHIDELTETSGGSSSSSSK